MANHFFRSRHFYVWLGLVALTWMQVRFAIGQSIDRDFPQGPLSAARASEQASVGQPALHIIHGQVLDASGRPVAKRGVHLIGVLRGCMKPGEGETSSALIFVTVPGWDFVTDATGEFTAVLRESNGWDTPEKSPGWGRYALVADSSADDAGAVSEELIMEPAGRAAVSASPDNEWGKAIAVPAELKVVLQLKSGITLSGKIWDAANPDKPLAGVSVNTNNDLHADTHSGHGGEILRRAATSDANGAFTITHIYPTKFFVGLNVGYGLLHLGEPNDHYWLKTKVDGMWTDDLADEITPMVDQSHLQIEMQVSNSRLFSFAGTVLDPQRRPVPNAGVTFAVSYHPNPKTFEDDHTFQNTTTDAAGHYRLMLGTPWLSWTRVEAVGFDKTDQWDEEYIPGFVHGFVLQPKAATPTPGK